MNVEFFPFAFAEKDAKWDPLRIVKMMVPNSSGPMYNSRRFRNTGGDLASEHYWLPFHTESNIQVPHVLVGNDVCHIEGSTWDPKIVSALEPVPDVPNFCRVGETLRPSKEGHKEGFRGFPLNCGAIVWPSAVTFRCVALFRCVVL